MKNVEESPFDFFKNSDKVEESIQNREHVSVLDNILDARKNNSEAIIYLISQSLNRIKAGFLKNIEFSGDANKFMNRFVEQVLLDTKRETGPFWVVDILDSNDDKAQLEQLGIEFYSFSKNLTLVPSVSEDSFSEEQETHPVIKETGFISYLSGINPEYAQILSHMAHYTPSDEIVQEMELPGLSSLKNKITNIRQLAQEYFQSPDRQNDFSSFSREV